MTQVRGLTCKKCRSVTRPLIRSRIGPIDNPQSGPPTAPMVSNNLATVTITVNGLNDAPVVDTSGTMTLTAINEDVLPSANTGSTVRSIIDSSAANSDDAITDVDTGAVEGIAVTSVDDANGTWEYSVNGGTNWTAFGAVSNTAAVLLDTGSQTRIRFVPNPDFNVNLGIPTIEFRAWDQTGALTVTRESMYPLLAVRPRTAWPRRPLRSPLTRSMMIPVRRCRLESMSTKGQAHRSP